jgi:hypothetical protein
MKRTSAFLPIFVISISCFIFHGCASNKALTKKEGMLDASLECVRYETPGIMKKTTTGTFLLASAAIALPGGSALIVLGDDIAQSNGERMQETVPDFGSLVINKLGERLNNGHKSNPIVTVMDQPIPEERIVPSLPGQPAPEKREVTSTRIEVKVKKIVYGYVDPFKGEGFLADTVATLRDPKGDVLWQKDYTYFSKDFSRSKEIEEYEANGGKFLKEEFDFAADKTAAAFFNDLSVACMAQATH